MDNPSKERTRGALAASASASLLGEESFRKILRRAVVWPLVAIGVVMALLLGVLSYLFDSANWVDHTNQVLVEISHAEELVIDMETGIRGYRITGDKVFLEPVQRATAAFLTQLDVLENLVRDNSYQLNELRALRRSHQAWNEFATNVRARVEAGVPADVAAHVQSKALMDTVRAHIDAVQAHEQQLLAERSALLRRVKEVTVMAILLSALILAPVLALSARRALLRVNASYHGALANVESERERLSVTLFSIGDAVIATDAEGRITYMNPVAMKLTGWEMAEASGQPLTAVFKIINESSRQPVESPVEKVLCNGEVVGLANHTLLIAKDGREIPIADSAAPIRGQSSAINGVVLVFRDQTAERKAAEKLEWLASFPEGNPNPILELDSATGEIVYANSFTDRAFPDLRAKGLQHPFFHGLADVAKPLIDSKTEFARREIAIGDHCYAQTIRYVPESKRLRIYCSDITDSKHAEEARGKLAAIVESSEDAIVSKDLNGIITSWNNGAERLFGYTAREAIGKSITMLIPPDRLDEEPKILERIRRGELVEHFETVRLHKDGTLLDIFLTLSPVVDSQGRIIGASKIARDITDRKRARDALRESEERYRSLFESMDEGFCVIEMIFDVNEKPVDYRFIEVNPAFEKQAGMQGATGKRMLEFASEIESHWLENYGRVAMTGEPIRFADEYKSLKSWFDVYAFRVGDPSSRRVAVIFTNITKRKEAEAELLHSKAEIAAANEQLASRAKQLDSLVEKRTTELRETVQQLETFSYSIVHDMRAPLRSMRSFAGFLHQDYSEKLDSQARDYLRRIIESSARMDTLITDVLNYSRVSRGATDLAPVDLDRLVPEIIEQYPQLQEKAESIRVARPLPKVSGNAALLTQVFSNLLGNALKFVPNGRAPQVSVRGESNHESVRIWIEDNGIGVPPDQHERIFGLFQRLHRPDEYAGTGVGLAIVKRAVEKMGGKTGVESEPGKGSRFWIDLHLADRSVAETN